MPDFSTLDIQYAIENLGMKRAWEKDREDNIDATHPITMRVFINPQTKLVERAVLRLSLLAFRSYGSTTASTATVVQTSGGGLWFTEAGYTSGLDVTNSDGNHSHGGSTGTGGTDLHTHGISSSGGHSHTITVNHSHSVSIPAHAHPLEHGIYEGPVATGLTIKVNGVDVTAALGGPFNTDQTNLDLQPYLTSTGDNIITVSSGTTVDNPAGLGRVSASVYIQSYLP